VYGGAKFLAPPYYNQRAALQTVADIWSIDRESCTSAELYSSTTKGSIGAIQD